MAPSRAKEKCAQCMTAPFNIMKTLRELSGVHGGARLCRYLYWTSVDITGFTVETEIYYLLAMGRYGPLRSQISSCRILQLYSCKIWPLRSYC